MRTLRSAVAVAVLVVGMGAGSAPGGLAAGPGPRATEAELSRFAFWFLWDTVAPDPGAAQVDAVVHRLQQGTSRGALAREATRGPRWAAKVVDDLYLLVLERPADPTGRTYWVGRVQGGTPVRHVAVALYASPEYYADRPSPSGFVTNLYRDILQRYPDDAGEEYWVSRLRAGASRSSVAGALYQSGESRRTRVDALYRTLLGRRPGPGDATYWAGRLVREDDLVLTAHLLASAEYFARAQGRPEPVGPPTTVRTTSFGSFTHGPSLAVSADGSTIAQDVIDGTTHIDVTDLDTGTTETVLADLPESPFGYAQIDGLAVSSDGELVAVALDGTVQLVDRSSDTVTEIGEATGGPSLSDPQLSGDGTTLAAVTPVTDSSTAIVVHDIATGDEETVAVAGNQYNSAPDLSADGRFVAFTSMHHYPADGEVFQIDVLVHDRVTGVTTQVTEGIGASFLGGISADGSTVVLESTAAGLVPGDVLDDGPRGDVYAWTRATGTLRRISWGDLDARGASVSADGSRIAYYEDRGRPLEGSTMVVWSRTTGQTTVLEGGEWVAARITDDGRHAFARSGGFTSPTATTVRWDLPA
jgi:hypothetical protein